MGPEQQLRDHLSDYSLFYSPKFNPSLIYSKTHCVASGRLKILHVVQSFQEMTSSFFLLPHSTFYFCDLLCYHILCTHHALPLARSWWCFHHWALIHQTPQRNYHRGCHHWHQNTLQLNLQLKEAYWMSVSHLQANNGGRERGRNKENSKSHKEECPKEPGWQVQNESYLS